MFKIFRFTFFNNAKMFYLVISIIAVYVTVAALLGSAIGEIQETGVYVKETVGVYNNLEDKYAAELDKLLESEYLQEITQISYIDKPIDVDALLKADDYITILICENNNGKNSISVHTVFEESFMLNICSVFAETANTVAITIETAPQTVNKLISSYNNSYFNTVKLQKGSPVGTDYYGIVSMLQISVLLAILAVYSVLDDRMKNIHPRITLSPISKTKVILGRFAADTVFIWIIMILMAVASHLILGVNWSGNTFVILAAFLSFSITIVLLGMISAKLTRTIFGALGIIMGFGTIIWPRYAGAISPYLSSGKIAYTAPGYYIKNILFTTIYSDANEPIVEGFIYIGIIIVVMAGIYILLERSIKNERI